jgi:hypothetical protein
MQFMAVLQEWGFDGLNLIGLLLLLKMTAENRAKLNYVEGVMNAWKQSPRA